MHDLKKFFHKQKNITYLVKKIDIDPFLQHGRHSADMTFPAENMENRLALNSQYTLSLLRYGIKKTGYDNMV